MWNDDKQNTEYRSQETECRRQKNAGDGQDAPFTPKMVGDDTALPGENNIVSPAWRLGGQP